MPCIVLDNGADEKEISPSTAKTISVLDQLQMGISNTSKSHIPLVYLCHHIMILHQPICASLLLLTLTFRVVFLLFQWMDGSSVLDMRSMNTLRKGQKLAKVVVIPKMTGENTSWTDAVGADIEFSIYTVDDPLISEAPANKGHEAMVRTQLCVAEWTVIPHRYISHTSSITTMLCQILRSLCTLTDMHGTTTMSSDSMPYNC